MVRGQGADEQSLFADIWSAAARLAANDYLYSSLGSPRQCRIQSADLEAISFLCRQALGHAAVDIREIYSEAKENTSPWHFERPGVAIYRIREFLFPQ